jgi:hypothetical protein
MRFVPVMVSAFYMVVTAHAFCPYVGLCVLQGSDNTCVFFYVGLCALQGSDSTCILFLRWALRSTGKWQHMRFVRTLGTVFYREMTAHVFCSYVGHCVQQGTDNTCVFFYVGLCVLQGSDSTCVLFLRWALCFTGKWQHMRFVPTLGTVFYREVTAHAFCSYVGHCVLQRTDNTCVFFLCWPLCFTGKWKHKYNVSQLAAVLYRTVISHVLCSTTGHCVIQRVILHV